MMKLLGPYMLILKLGAAVLGIAAWFWAWHAFTGHYEARGAARVQAQWDAQKARDMAAKLEATEAARARESLHYVQQIAILNNLYEDTQNEIQDRDNALAVLRADTRRLRTVTGKSEPDNGVRSTATDTDGRDETCTVRLPAEIGREFRALREDHIRITSKANEVARQLKAAQAILIQDRETCGVKPK